MHHCVVKAAVKAARLCVQGFFWLLENPFFKPNQNDDEMIQDCHFVPQVVREIVELSHHSMTFCCLICCSSLIVWRCQGYLFTVNATLRN